MSGSPRPNAAEIDRLALAVAKEPGSKAFIPLAEEYGKAGMWQEAAAVLEDGLKTYPNFITAMVALGRVYEQLNQPVKAKALLEEAVKISPENLRAHRTLAKIYAAQGSADSALRSCHVILSVNPQDEEALALRASLGPTSHADPAGSSGPAALPAEKRDSSFPETPLAMELAEPLTVDSDRASRDESSMPAAPPTRTNFAAVQLERWLNMIRSRRRDREPPHSASSIS